MANKLKNDIPNRVIMSQVLKEEGKKNKDVVVLTSDSRGSAKLDVFVEAIPEQLVEVGIAEQNIVGIAAGLAHSGKRSFVVSPAAFLSMRSIEQIKVDVAYSNTNVKLVGISGGVAYGQLGMSHHSLQDLAVTRAIPNLQVMMPADRFETERMFEALAKTSQPAYIRIGRNPVEDVYENKEYNFEIGKAVTMLEGEDITLVATGEMVRIAMDAAYALRKDGINCRVLNMHTIKPLDEEAILQAAKETRRIITLEEHSIYGGLGAAVSEVVSQEHPVPMKILGIPDEPAITGSAQEVFNHYGLNVDNISQITKQMIGK